MNIDPSLRRFTASRRVAWRIAAAIALVLHWSAPALLPTAGAPDDSALGFSVDSRGSQLGALPRGAGGLVKIEGDQKTSSKKAWIAGGKPHATLANAPDLLSVTHSVPPPIDRAAAASTLLRLFDPRAPPA
jgi:hypothetical protein